jgi:hypothetical protein
VEVMRYTIQCVRIDDRWRWYIICFPVSYNAETDDFKVDRVNHQYVSWENELKGLRAMYPTFFDSAKDAADALHQFLASDETNAIPISNPS